MIELRINLIFVKFELFIIGYDKDWVSGSYSIATA